MDLSTTTRVKTYGGIDTSDFDTLLGVLVTAYSHLFERLLDRHAEVIADRTEYFNIDRGDRSIYLEGFPVTSVTSISNDVNWDFTTVVDSSSYTILGDRGKLAFDHDLTPGPTALKVVYAGGMAANTTAFITAFPEIALALDVQVFHHFQRRHDLGAVSSSVESSTVSTTPEFAVLGIVKELLAPYTRDKEK